MKKETKEITIDKKLCIYKPENKPGIEEYKIIFDINKSSFYTIPKIIEHTDHVNNHEKQTIENFRGATVTVFNKPDKLEIIINNEYSNLGPIPCKHIEEIKRILHKNFHTKLSLQT